MPIAQSGCISFVLPIQPQTKKRPRFNSNTGHAYNEQRYREWKELAAIELRQLWRDSKRVEPLDRVKKVAVQFYGSSFGVGDLEGLFGAIADAAVDAGVLKDDSLKVFSHLEAAFEKCEKSQERIEMYLFL